MTKWFLAIEFFLYLVFMSITCQVNGDTSLSILLKFISIVFCCLYVLYQTVRKQAYSLWISFSFLLFVCSDYFLLLKDSYRFGLCMFIMVQFCFLCSLRKKHGERVRRIIIVAMTSVLLLFLIRQIGFMMDATLGFAVIYFLLFSSNLFDAVKECRKHRSSRSLWFAIGLLLYFVCDLNVGIFNLSSYSSIHNPIFVWLYDFSVVGMWLFYLPGVVCLALSNSRTLYEV